VAGVRIAIVIWTCRKLVVRFVRPENSLPQRKGVGRADSLDLERHSTTIEIGRRSPTFAARRPASWQSGCAKPDFRAMMSAEFGCEN
jgi:hypothetical protein